MADFVAVLRKTIGGLGDNTPEMREKVYDKARATIEAKLAALNPQPPAVVVERQRKALEDAIAVVRTEYDVPATPDLNDDLEQYFSDLNAKPQEAVVPVEDAAPVVEHEEQTAPSYDELPAETEAYGQPDVHEDVQPSYEEPYSSENYTSADADNASHPDAYAPYEADQEPVHTQDYVEPAYDHYEDAPDHANTHEPVAVEHHDDAYYHSQDRHDGHDEPYATHEPAPSSDVDESERGLYTYADNEPKRSRKGLIAAIVALLVLGGIGYGAWANKDSLLALLPQSSDTAAPEVTEEPTDAQTASEAPPSQEEAPAAPSATATEQSEKYTQRLMPDGNEVDEGPAGGQPSIGEGTSLATAVQPTQQDAVTPPLSTQNEQTSPATAQEGPRAIFYEERTSTAQGSAEAGSISWTLVQESPGANLPPEPAIRADARIPGKDLQLRMTIRRNGDDTLPASHIIEMIFLTPDGFEGGSISNVSRISFKDTEQATGNPLIGIPAKIADGFFLIALGDAPAEIENNLLLLRRENWVDIPIVYQSGRRALLSLEKGSDGEAVFQEVLQGWSQNATR